MIDKYKLSSTHQLIGKLDYLVINLITTLPKFGIETPNREIVWHFLHLVVKRFFFCEPQYALLSILFSLEQNRTLIITSFLVNRHPHF
jgi:hypothetical protein